MVEGGPSPNRIELESQILCASLRQSWAQEDEHGVIVVAKQLCELFPDLIPPFAGKESAMPSNLYEFFGMRCDASQEVVVSCYFQTINGFLRLHNTQDKSDDYRMLLDAGYILRKPRLRLSHDLIVVRDWLLKRNAIPIDGTIDFLETIQEKVLQPAIKVEPIKLPQLVNLMEQAQIIGSAEVLALTNQSKLAPEIPIEDLILSAGYVTEAELKSLQLAEYLFRQGKITMPQFMVAMYDERNRGIRMAESLQSRGWLDVEAKK
jgi:hypothetical protein